MTLHGSPEEIKAAQLGARAMIEQRIGGLRSAARQRTARPEADFNLQKFQILFGTKEATRLAKLLRDEKDIARIGVAARVLGKARNGTAL